MKAGYQNRREFLKTTGWGIAAFSLNGLNLKKEKEDKPRLFDVRADKIPEQDCLLIKPWKHFSLDPDYAGSWIVSR